MLAVEGFKCLCSGSLATRAWCSTKLLCFDDAAIEGRSPPQNFVTPPKFVSALVTAVPTFWSGEASENSTLKIEGSWKVGVTTQCWTSPNNYSRLVSKFTCATSDCLACSLTLLCWERPYKRRAHAWACCRIGSSARFYSRCFLQDWITWHPRCVDNHTSQSS